MIPHSGFECGKRNEQRELSGDDFVSKPSRSISDQVLEDADNNNSGGCKAAFEYD